MFTIIMNNYSGKKTTTDFLITFTLFFSLFFFNAWQADKKEKPQQKIAISAITIKTVTLNTIKLDGIDTVQLHDIKISIPNLNEGYVSNQLGGELLLTFLSLAG